MPETKGWLLDLFEDPTDGVILYCITTDQKRLRLRYSLPVTFYAMGSNTRLRALWHFLSSHFPGVTLRRETRNNVFASREETVLAVETPTPHQQRRIFQKVSQKFPDLQYADADIQLSLRFCAVTGVFPTAFCHLTFDDMGHVQEIQPLETPYVLNPSPIPLRIMSITPNEDPNHTQPSNLQIDFAHDHYQLDLHAERALLINLRALLKRYDPDLLLTDWGDTWLLPFLLSKSQELGIDLPLNREENAKVRWQKERNFFSYGQIVYRGQTIQLFGRCHIDRRNAVLWKDYELDGILESCRITSLPLQTSARTSPGTGISSTEILTALREKVLVPWQKQQAEMLKPASELFLADQGGLVYQPKVGVHTDVAEIDFVSLYPAIMVHFNISPETILNDPNAANSIPALGMAIDDAVTGIVPKALEPLLLKRVSLKKEIGCMSPWSPQYKNYVRRASALKWLLVTCFGYLGYKNARFGRIEAHQAVTAYGREILLRAKETAEDMGFEVLHLYVDALWVKQPGKKEPQDFEDLLLAIQKRTGLPIALDGVYRWLVFLPSRQNENRPVPNRYFGVFQDGSLKIRGIDARRRDTPPFINQAQMQILELLKQHPTPEQALPAVLQHLRMCMRQLQDYNVPLEDLLVKKRLGRDLTAYRTLPASARAALQLEKIGKTLSPGQRVVFLYMLGKPGVHAWDLGTRPDIHRIDVAYYQELLLRAASTILQPWIKNETLLKNLIFQHGLQPPLPVPQKFHPPKHLESQLKHSFSLLQPSYQS